MQFYLILIPLASCSKKIIHATPPSDLYCTKSRISEIRSSCDLVLELQTTIQPGGDYASLELELKDDGQVAAFLKNLVINYTTVLERNLD